MSSSVQFKQRSPFNHVSIGSLTPYQIGSSNEISFNSLKLVPDFYSLFPNLTQFYSLN